MAVSNMEDYFNNLSGPAKEATLGFMSFMQAQFPKLSPRISYSMPMWWAGTKMYDGYVAISTAQRHFSIHFHEEWCLAELKNELPNCSFGKKCINIKYGDQAAFLTAKQKVLKYFSSIL